jgi:hypothetical protein
VAATLSECGIEVIVTLRLAARPHYSRFFGHHHTTSTTFACAELTCQLMQIV